MRGRVVTLADTGMPGPAAAGLGRQPVAVTERLWRQRDRSDRLGYPLWRAGIDCLDVVLGGTLVFVLLNHLRGMAQLWYLVVPSIALGAAAGVVDWPVSTAINSQRSISAKYVAAVASIGLSSACVHFIARALPRSGGRRRRRRRTHRG